MEPTKEYPDEQIISLLKTDSKAALERMFRKYHAMLCLAVLKVVAHEEVAEDLVQDVFVEVWKKRDSLVFTTSIGAYLRRAAVNRALNYIRDKKIKWDDEDKLQAMPSSLPVATQGLEAAELQTLVDRAIESLPERCRLVFTLSRFEEMTNQEIADQLEISIKTVENQMTKALRMLREALGV